MKNIALLAVLLFSAVVLFANVTMNYSLETPKIETKEQFTKVTLEKAQSWGQPGNPDLPWFGVKLLLPAGFEAEKIVVNRYNPVTYTLDKPIIPIQKSYPFSHTKIETPEKPNLEIYGSPLPYPQITDNGLNTSFMCGQPIAFSAISPFAYYPLTNELVFYRELSVEIIYRNSAKAIEAMRFLKQDAYTAKRLQNSVDNPQSIILSRTREPGIEYLIVADAAKVTQWTPLKTFHESRGKTVLIKSIGDIIAETAGADTQEKLRNYIISLYATNPLRYVFLAGDTDVIPHRGFYVNIDNSSEGVDADIPADMYYACLDGNWNDDGDSNWGEIYEEDLAPELAIGRFCYNSDTEIDNFLNKLTLYSNAPVANEIKSAFFVGEWLWDGPTWGGDYMDEMIGGCSTNGYTTIGVPTSWNITTLYDRTYGAADSWGASEIRPLLSAGPNLVNHLGHSNTTYTMRLSNNQVSSSTITNNGINHNFSTYFTQGCYSGAFDNRETSPGQYTSDCITEKMTSIATGPVAMISHSRYGWGTQGSTDGASQYIHRQFIDAIFGENIYDLGSALQDSKIDNIPFISNTPVMYWVSYETNLFGDPAMMLWTDTPQTIIANLPQQLLVGVNNYQIQTNAPYAEFILKDAQQTVCKTTADANGLLIVNFLAPLSPGTYSVYINAPNFYAFNTTITATAAQMPYLMCNNINVNDDDGLYQLGDTLSLNFYIKNVGLLDLSTPGTLTLSCNSSNIQIISPTVSFAAISAGDSVAVNTAFLFRVVGNYNDHTSILFTIRANYDSYLSNSNFSLNLNAPVLQLLSYQVNNLDAIILPGDTPSISFSIANNGSGYAYTPMMILFSNSPDIILGQDEVLLTSLAPNTTADYQSAINLQILDSAILDTNYLINYMFSAENGNLVEGDFMIHLGALNYTFENDYQNWEAITLNNNFVNQWHRSSYRNHTENGTYSMKFGGTGSAQYSGSAFGALESPVFNVNPGCELKFYHWMSAENHSTNHSYAWDGGFVQMSVNGGNWNQITPVGGYPYKIYNNSASPLSADTWVYSGSLDWTEATFELGNISGTAQFRWVFGSDGYVSGEGWYIDDVHVVGYVENEDETIPSSKEVVLYENYPNPFNPETTIVFSLPVRMPVCLEVFNVKGQLVNRLLNDTLPAGTHRIVFNGLDIKKRNIASGVYYYRITTPSGVQMRKMLLLK
ncbi:MAG TPA: C25 family cysteine peptidase [Candidatus Cloacimonas sp.]|jgi:hypothetical protein|nr:C25 family cysteine peptidase [Candidatus Cloacimonas sp.]